MKTIMGLALTLPAALSSMLSKFSPLTTVVAATSLLLLAACGGSASKDAKPILDAMNAYTETHPESLMLFQPPGMSEADFQSLQKTSAVRGSSEYIGVWHVDALVSDDGAINSDSPNIHRMKTQAHFEFLPWALKYKTSLAKQYTSTFGSHPGDSGRTQRPAISDNATLFFDVMQRPNEPPQVEISSDQGLPR